MLNNFQKSGHQSRSKSFQNDRKQIRENGCRQIHNCLELQTLKIQFVERELGVNAEAIDCFLQYFITPLFDSKDFEVNIRE